MERRIQEEKQRQEILQRSFTAIDNDVSTIHIFINSSNMMD